jgi:hypothetical protein
MLLCQHSQQSSDFIILGRVRLQLRHVRDPELVQIGAEGFEVIVDDSA